MVLGDAEVHHFDVAVGADHDVGRLQVAMDDAALVREVNRFGDLRRESHGLFARQRALA